MALLKKNALFSVDTFWDVENVPVVLSVDNVTVNFIPQLILEIPFCALAVFGFHFYLLFIYLFLRNSSFHYS